MLTGIFIAAVGLTMIIARVMSKHRVKNETGIEYHFRIHSWPRLIYTMALLLGYIVLLEPIGFILATFLLMFGLFLDYRRRNYGWSLFFAAVTALVSYLVFEVWLRCQLPRGFLPWW